VVPRAQRQRLGVDVELAVGEDVDPHRWRRGVEPEHEPARRHVDDLVAEHPAGDPCEPRAELLAVGRAPEEPDERAEPCPRLARARASLDPYGHVGIFGARAAERKERAIVRAR
jgi:hypothetical protein